MGKDLAQDTILPTAIILKEVYLGKSILSGARLKSWSAGFSNFYIGH